MSHGTDGTVQPDPDYQHAFRNAAAGLIKSLIRARARQEPTFLTDAEYIRWGVIHLAEENRNCDRLLSSVLRLHGRFETKFLLEQDSVPFPITGEEANSFDQLVEQISSFINVNELNNAILDAAGNNTVHWALVADWASLGPIRDALDKLPSSVQLIPAEERLVAKSKKVSLLGLREHPIVNGQKKPPLGPAQYRLIEKLISAGEEGCSKTQLESVTTNYWQSLNALKKSDEDWDTVIHFPGKPHGGYWID